MACWLVCLLTGEQGAARGHLQADHRQLQKVRRDHYFSQPRHATLHSPTPRPLVCGRSVGRLVSPNSAPLTVIRDIELRQGRRGDIIRFYNDVYIPVGTASPIALKRKRERESRTSATTGERLGTEHRLPCLLVCHRRSRTTSCSSSDTTSSSWRRRRCVSLLLTRYSPTPLAS